jgi:alpha-L-fucosidase
MKKHAFTLLLVLVLPLGLAAQQIGGGGEAYPNLKTNAASLTKWQDMRFGLFIHWGPVTLRGTEIGWSRGTQVPVSDYDSLYKEFNPVLFNAREWVTAAKSAGVKYLVITTKHHDGFSLWDSKQTDYDIMSTPFHRDVVKELSEECARQGIVFGTYYSILDWHHPYYTTRHGDDPRPVKPSDMPLYIEYLKKQVAELVRIYKTRILWFDGQWEDSWTHNDGMDLYAYCRGLDDTLLINNRVDKGRKDERGLTVSPEYAGDFGTPEQEIGPFHPDMPWESCITICQQWAWKPNDTLKSAKECIQTLARTAGGGGNLLLNVGPMLDGRIEQRQVDRLTDIGRWLQRNGESIYGTRGGPFKPSEMLSSTHKGSRVYVHLFKWPDSSLDLPELKGRKILSSSILGGQKLAVETAAGRIKIMLPGRPDDENDTVIVLEMDSSVEGQAPLEVTPQAPSACGSHR